MLRSDRCVRSTKAPRSVFLEDLPPEHVVYESRKRGFSSRDSDLPADSSSKTPHESWDEGQSLRPGQRITRHIFGPGVVNQVDGKGKDAVVTVAFFGSGIKKILASYLTV